MKARDITSEFLRASSSNAATNFRQYLDTDARIGLAVGELVKDETFSLFDAVGALEVSGSGHAPYQAIHSAMS